MAWHGWEHLGVRGQGNLPPIAGQFRGLDLLVCASGRTLWDDLARYGQRRGHVMAVNWAGCHLPLKIDHWASLHPDMLVHWLALHAIWRGHEGHVWTHSHKPWAGVEFTWDFELQPACSGFFAALLGLALGYDCVVLAGCPETLDGHYYDTPGSPGSYTTNYGHQGMWIGARDTCFAGRVKSLSGNTRDWLGAPDGL